MMTLVRQVIAVPLFLLGMGAMWTGVFFSWLSSQFGAAALWVLKP